MTIKSRGYTIETAADLFVPNDCLNLELPVGAGSASALACISITRGVSRASAAQREDIRWDCLQYASETVLCHLGPLTWWLFAATSGYDTRVTRHLGLWKSIAKDGVPKGPRATAETFVKRGEYVDIYGATDLAPSDLARARTLVGPPSRCFLALLPPGEPPDVEHAIASGWRLGPGHLDELRGLAVFVSRNGGVLLRLCGSFDEREAGVDLIMPPAAYTRAVALLPGSKRE